ncbi:uncharacterized protein At5g43822-like isoform X2 [Arachis hypogaea]|uniref:uncharacterized protein At5g43822-like isoform X2 n=1 Tax=Arachis hypogaea TaxID=3818 RepID=UPI000DECC44D|nr:uncharacterized protein At5g43822-like isoform X2 [Arachis hypogaea]XP_025660344.1 uncharacterized protein At5g43822-like isoform X2 [Arachis hypogaea]
MEGVMKKFQGKFLKVREQLNRWDELQSCLISQFRSASSIIDRLQVLQNPSSYGCLSCNCNVRDALLANQMKSLDNILVSMRSTFRQLVKGSSTRSNMKHLQQQVGVKPTLMDCLDGLLFLHDVHHSEYLLKSSIISTLSANALKKPSSGDLVAIQQLLVDQPNLLIEEVQRVFDIIFAEEL